MAFRLFLNYQNKGLIKMIIHIEQIPAECDLKDYPPGTEFIFIDDKPLKRDPATFRLIPHEKKPLIYPEDAWKEYRREKR